MAIKIGDIVKVYNGDDLIANYIGNVTDSGIKPNDYLEVCDSDDNMTLVKPNQIRKHYTHISPSGLKTFETNRTEFYLKYIARHAPGRIPQNEPMAVGSAFDAYIKHTLIQRLGHSDKLKLSDIYDGQVEEQNRNNCHAIGLQCLENYKNLGAYSDLLVEMAGGVSTPAVELDYRGSVMYQDSSLQLAGKPDWKFKTSHTKDVIIDWKVNGYCGRSKQSPKPGYIVSRSIDGRKIHKDAMIVTVGGIDCNIAMPLEIIDRDWATQLATYGWLMGEPVGGDFICGIEQLIGCNRQIERCVSYRNIVSPAFQKDLYQRYIVCQNAVDNQYFADVSADENTAKCLELEQMALLMNSHVGDTKEEWFDHMVRRESYE